MNKLLQDTQSALLAKVDPQLVPIVQKVADAGKKVLYSPQTQDMVVQQLQHGTDPETIGSGVAKLSAILMNQSKGTIPPKVLFPASLLLLLEVLSFLEEAGAVKVTPDFLAQCTQAVGSAYLQSLGVTPEKLSQLTGGKADDMAQPEQAEQPAEPVQQAMQSPLGATKVTKTTAPAGILQSAMKG